MAKIEASSENEVQEALAFTRNFEKAGGKVKPRDGGGSCTSNCDCYVETEYTTAAGVAGYRYGS